MSGFVVFEREAPRDLRAALERAASQLGERVEVSGDGALTLRIGEAELSVTPSAATETDHAEAASRAAACGAAGLDLLARRCARLYRVEQRTGEARTLWVAQAVMALALLGPVMPDDERVIYGVRGARARLTATAGAASSR